MLLFRNGLRVLCVRFRIECFRDDLFRMALNICSSGAKIPDVGVLFYTSLVEGHFTRVLVFRLSSFSFVQRMEATRLMLLGAVMQFPRPSRRHGARANATPHRSLFVGTTDTMHASLQR